jgi:hypothetical protein
MVDALDTAHGVVLRPAADPERVVRPGERDADEAEMRGRPSEVRGLAREGARVTFR